MKTRLRRIVLSNFRSFVGQHSIDFDDSGLVLLRGESGAGKSTILIAIAYALGFSPYSAKDLQSDITEDPMSVELHLETDEGTAILTRGEKLTLALGEEKVRGSAKVVEERLDRLCGVNKHLRQVLTYRDQAEPVRFLRMPDAELKSFLSDVLGLQKLESEIETRSKELSDIEKKLAAEEAALASWKELMKDELIQPKPPVLQDKASLEILEASLATMKLHLENKNSLLKQAKHQFSIAEALEKSQAEDAQARFLVKVRDLESQIQAIRSQPLQEPDRTELDRIDSLIKECGRHLSAAQQAEKDAEAAFNAEANRMRLQLKPLTMAVGAEIGIKKELKKLREESVELAQLKCPTCSRAWDEAQEKLIEIRNRMLTLVEELGRIDGLKPQIESIEKELADRVFLPDPKVHKLSAVFNQLTSQKAQEEARIRELSIAEEVFREKRIAGDLVLLADARRQATEAYHEVLHNPNRPSLKIAVEITKLSNEVASLELKLVNLNKDLEHAVFQNHLLQSNYRDSLLKYEEVRNKLSLNEKTVASLQGHFKKESDYLDLLKGFFSRIFDEVLDQIGTEANNILARLPNASHVTVELRSEKETAKGTTQQKVTPYVFFGGKLRPLKSGASGGMRTSVELAVDLAFAKVIANRANAYLPFLLLDESFNGHDRVTKEGCLEVLREYAQDRLVLVVDHDSEFKEMFSRTIDVVLENERSRILES